VIPLALSRETIFGATTTDREEKWKLYRAEERH
jgi:hypothetical protein